MPVVSTVNNTGVSNPVVGGLAIGITSASNVTDGQPINQSFPVISGTKVLIGDNLPVVNTDSGVTNVTYALASTGNFAYRPNSLFYGYTSTINGSANNGIKFPAVGNQKHKYIRTKAFGAKTSTAIRSGYLDLVGANTSSRNPWTTQPASNSGQFISTTNTSNVAVDEGIYVTYKAVPGEFVYRNGSPTTIYANYDAR